jgi:hypothetical protein
MNDEEVLDTRRDREARHPGDVGGLLPRRRYAQSGFVFCAVGRPGALEHLSLGGGGFAGAGAVHARDSSRSRVVALTGAGDRRRGHLRRLYLPARAREVVEVGVQIGKSVGSIPTDLLLVGRTLGLLDGITRQLDPGMDTMEIVARRAIKATLL